MEDGRIGANDGYHRYNHLKLNAEAAEAAEETLRSRFS
jgi:hypothetical protein